MHTLTGNDAATLTPSVRQHRAGERVQAEGADGFGEALFDVHPPGIGLDDLAGRECGPVGDQQGGLVVSQAGDGELADGPGVGRQLDGGVVVDHTTQEGLVLVPTMCPVPPAPTVPLPSPDPLPRSRLLPDLTAAGFCPGSA